MPVAAKLIQPLCETQNTTCPQADIGSDIEPHIAMQNSHTYISKAGKPTSPSVSQYSFPLTNPIHNNALPPPTPHLPRPNHQPALPEPSSIQHNTIPDPRRRRPHLPSLPPKSPGRRGHTRHGPRGHGRVLHHQRVHSKPEFLSVLEHRHQHGIVPPSDSRRYLEYYGVGFRRGYHHHDADLELW
jgi:hypothetical protein